MNYILFDGTVRNALLPFTFTRPVADIRVGIFTIREKWEQYLGYTTSTLTEELDLGLQTKEDIEEILNIMMDDLCEIFRGFSVMGGDVLYPERGDNPWEHPNTIYLEVSAPDVSLEDLNPDWTEDEYYLVD